MEKSTYIGLGIFILIVAGGLFFLKGGSSTLNGNVVFAGNQALPEETQQVIISERNLNYYPNEIKVKAGQPVSITLDSSVKGCLRSFTIRNLGVSKYVKTPDETIDFTPTKKGKYIFACSMGMGYGSLIVE